MIDVLKLHAEAFELREQVKTIPRDGTLRLARDAIRAAGITDAELDQMREVIAEDTKTDERRNALEQALARALRDDRGMAHAPELAKLIVLVTRGEQFRDEVARVLMLLAVAKAEVTSRVSL